MGNYILKDPLWLLALLIIPMVLWLRQRRHVPVLLVPFAAAWHQPSLASISRLPVILAGIGLALIACGLARPQRIDGKHEVRSQGYDIMLVIDLSGSMLAEDYERDGMRLNRLQTIKPVIQAFIDRRPDDRIGVIVFAKNAYTLSPLTSDHAWLTRQIERIRIGLVDPNATAIGDGLGLALTRLDQPARIEQGRRKGAFVILLTDGANNSGALAPKQAADIASARGVPVYTIGAGSKGWAPMPQFDDAGNKVGYVQIPADIDEDALIDIAATTNGKYFRAADSDTIEHAFTAIDRAQKIEFQAESHLITTEFFPWFVAPGIALLLAAGLLAGTRPPGALKTSTVASASGRRAPPLSVKTP
ncbi:MAG TPA: VWA domain-containing protein [Opitutaceae bacterium]|nr:VWA domain-containing protein [Opitutaceae bacterium]